MRQTRLTLNTMQLDVHPVPQSQSHHIALLTARQQQLLSRCSVPTLPTSPPRITFRCFGWEDREQLRGEGGKRKDAKLTHWTSSEIALPMIQLKGPKRGKGEETGREWRKAGRRSE